MWPQFPKNIYIVPCQPIARACCASHLASFQKKIKNISFVPWSSYKSLKWLNTCIKVNSYNANRCLASTVSVLIRHYWEFSFVQWAPCLSRTQKNDVFFSCKTANESWQFCMSDGVTSLAGDSKLPRMHAKALAEPERTLGVMLMHICLQCSN